MGEPQVTINGRSRVELAMLGGIAVAMFWGGWYAKDVGSAVADVRGQVSDIKSSLRDFPTRYELQTLVKSSISDETKDVREKLGGLEARLQAIEKKSSP